MPKRSGERMLGVARDEVPVTVAYAGGFHTNQNFATLGKLKVEGSDLDGGLDLFENGGADFHLRRLLRFPQIERRNPFFAGTEDPQFK